MDDAADLDDVGVEQPQGAGQRNHHPGQAVVGHVVQRLQVHVALTVRRQFHHLEPGHGRRRRVGAVGAVGDGHLGAPGLSLAVQVGLDHQHPGQLAVGPGQRGQADGREAGDLAEESLQPVQQLQRALRLLGRLQRVDAGEPGQEGRLVVDLGVVLHGTTAQRVEMSVDGEIALAQPGEILHHLRLGKLRQRQIIAQQGRVGHWLWRYVRLRQHRSGPSRHAALHQQFGCVAVSALTHFSVS